MSEYWMGTRDWRKEYVICEHVAADEKVAARHRGFRVCCEACWDAGFLTVEDVHAEERPDGLSVGKLIEPGFTLIELCIVVVIIGILTAIAIPNFLAMQDNARAACVKANMHNLQLAAESHATWNMGIYTGDVREVMESDDAPHNFVNPFTHATGEGAAWEQKRRKGDPPTEGARGIVSYAGDAYGFWIHGNGKTAALNLVLRSGYEPVDSPDEPPPPPIGGGPTE